MKHCLLLPVLVLLLAACKHQLKVTDLKFADFEKDAIVKNQVDTMYLISNSQFLQSGTDTIGYEAYDSGGNLLVQQQMIAGHNRAAYDYDSIGLVRRKNYDTDYIAQYDVNYKFDPDRLTLYQFWTGNASDTSVFKFDKKGNLLEAVDCSDVDSGREFHYKTTYMYNPAGQLTRKRRELLVSTKTLKKLEKDLGIPISNEDTTDFYYDNSILSASITSRNYAIHPQQNYCAKTYYRPNGLRDMTVGADNRVTNYVYSIREANETVSDW